MHIAHCDAPRRCDTRRMAEPEGTAHDRLQRVLACLGVSGGAALVSKATGRLIAVSGEIDERVALVSAATEVTAASPLVHVPPDALVCDVGATYRLVVRVGADLAQDAGFALRVRRAREVLERYVVPSFRPPASAPPGAAPAHAAVYARSGPRRN
jgi:hypothetical protein